MWGAPTPNFCEGVEEKKKKGGGKLVSTPGPPGGGDFIYILYTIQHILLP